MFFSHMEDLKEKSEEKGRKDPNNKVAQLHLDVFFSFPGSLDSSAVSLFLASLEALFQLC